MTQQLVADPPTERSLDPADWTAFRSLSHRMLDLALDHTESVRDRLVWTPVPEAVKAALCEPLPMAPQGAEKVCADLTELILPYGTGNTHPRFFGWIHGSGTPSGIIAEMLAAALGGGVGVYPK